MRTEGCEAQTLRALASMPFLDRTEMVAVTGWSKAAVHEAVDSWTRAASAPPYPTPPPSSPHRPRGSTSPPPGWGGWPRRRRPPWTSLSATAPSPPSGGAT